MIKESHQQHLVDIEAIILHPSYTPSSSNVQVLNDISLIIFKEEIQWNDTIQPICLPEFSSNRSSTVDKLYTGQMATAVGWGFTREYTNDVAVDILLPNRLQQVEVPIVNNSQCEMWYNEFLSRFYGKMMDSSSIDDSIICAGYEEGGKDACRGDSGGPLLIKEGGRQMVVGLVSSGIGCSRPKLPGLYTRVSSYIEWIMGTLAAYDIKL